MYAHSLTPRRDIFFQISSQKRTSQNERKPENAFASSLVIIMPVTGWLRGTVKAVPSGDTVLIVANAGPTVRFRSLFFHSSRVFPFGRIISSLSLLSRPSKQIGCDVTMFRLFSLSRALRALLLSHRNHHIVSRSIILSRVIKAFVVAFSFFKRSLTILLLLLHRVRAHRRKRLSPWQASSPREWYGNFWSHFLLRARTIMFVYK